MRREPQSYGVPVRAAAPPPPPPAAYVPQEVAVAAPFAAAAAGYAPAPVSQPNPVGPPAYARPGWAPPVAPPGSYPAPYGQQGWAPAPNGYPPMPYAPATKSNVARNVFMVIGALVGIPILAAIAIPVFLAQRGMPVMPTTLAGRPVASDSVVAAASTEADTAIKKANPGHKITSQWYVLPDGRPELIVVAQRGNVPVSKQVVQLRTEGMGIDPAAGTDFGSVTCFVVTGTLNGSACLWSGSISGAVLQIANTDLQTAAVIAREAKSAIK